MERKVFFYPPPQISAPNFNPDVSTPTMFLPSNVTITRPLSNPGDRVLVNVSHGNQGNYPNTIPYNMQGYQQHYPVQPPMSQQFHQPYMMSDGSSPYNVYAAQQNGYFMTSQMQHMQLTQQSLPPEPPKKHEKKILKITNPETNQEVVLDTKPSEAETIGVHKEQPVKEENPEEDAKIRFAKAIATRAIDMTEKSTPEEKVPSAVAVPALSPAPPSQTATPTSTPMVPSETPTPEQANYVQEEDFTELEEVWAKLCNEESEDIENRKYSFIVLDMFHEVIKRFKKAQPTPEVMDDLQRLGLDIQSDPPQQQHTRNKYPMNPNPFNPNWQSANNQTIIGNRKNPYQGRPSDHKTSRKKPISNRPSATFERNQMRTVAPAAELFRPAENAWKPKRYEESESDETAKKYEAARKEIRSILNKITPSSYADLALEFYALNVEADTRLQTISIDLIFDKAVEEPKFCSLYTGICRGQVDRGGRKENSFFRAMIQKCQSTFLGKSLFGEAIDELTEKLKDETDEKKKADLQERREMLKGKEKRCLLGNIKFISHLFTANLLSNSVVSSCIYSLQEIYMNSKDDIYIQYAIELLELVADIYFSPEAKKKREEMKGVVDNVDAFVHWIPMIKEDVSTKVKVMIMNFEDFVRSGYKPRNADTGPKTIAEIHEDAKKEDAENTKERNAYDIQHRANQRQQQPPRYAHRPSLDKKNPVERLTKAANASSNVGNTTIKPAHSIKQLFGTDTVKLGSRSTGNNFFSQNAKMTGGSSNSQAPLSSTPVAETPPNDHNSAESDGGIWSVVRGSKGTATNHSRKTSRERH